MVKIDVTKDFAQFEKFVSLLKQLRSFDKGATAKHVRRMHAPPNALSNGYTHSIVHLSHCSLHGAQDPLSRQHHGTPAHPRSSLVGCFQCKWPERAKQILTACLSTEQYSTDLLHNGEPSQLGTPPQQRHKQDSHSKRHADCWLCPLSHRHP